MTRRLLLIATLILLSWPTPPASAHTDLVSITPAEGSRVLGGWPPEVVLAFTEASLSIPRRTTESGSATA